MYPILNIINLCPKDIPRLDLGDKTGMTGYIDFIKPTDMSNSLMRGTDAQGRKFLAIKVSIYDQDNKYLSDVVGTIFERYSDNTDNLAYGTSYIISGENSNEYHLWYDSRIRLYDMDNLFKRINLLVAGETLKTINDENITVQGSGNYYLKLSEL